MRIPSHDGPASPRARSAAALALPLALLLLGCRPQQDAVAAQGVEVCDGVDNDGDGVADDLDANGDGICDCLRIGVYGYPSQAPTDDLMAWMHGVHAVPTAILAGQVLTRQLLATVDVLVIQDVQDGTVHGTVGQAGRGLGIGRTFSEAEAQVLKAWVDAGGGLMTLTGYTNDAAELANVNRLLAPFGVSYASTPYLSDASLMPVTHWDSTHPIASGISRIGVKGAFPVQGAGTAVAWEPAQGANDLGRVLDSGRGRVFAWGDEWITLDPEWIDTSYQPQQLWVNAMRWLTPAGRCRIARQ